MGKGGGCGGCTRTGEGEVVKVLLPSTLFGWGVLECRFASSVQVQRSFGKGVLFGIHSLQSVGWQKVLGLANQLWGDINTTTTSLQATADGGSAKLYPNVEMGGLCYER